MKKNHILYFSIIILLFSCQEQQTTASSEKHEQETFSFAYMTDMHLTDERQAVEGFVQALDTMEQYKPDFFITGGDLIMDALIID